MEVEHTRKKVEHKEGKILIKTLNKNIITNITKNQKKEYETVKELGNNK